MSPPGTLGIYVPGCGAGEWRAVNSLLARIDPEEFNVVLFAEREGLCKLRPGIQVDYATAGAALPDVGAETCKSRDRWLKRLLRRTVPRLGFYYAGYGKTCLRVARRFRRHAIDLLHAHNTGCVEPGPVAARIAGIPRVVATFHVDPSYALPENGGGASSRVLEFLSNHCIDRGIGVSQATSASWVRRSSLAPRRLVSIYNGINTDHWRRRRSPADARAALGLPADGRLIVGGVGRLHPQKGFQYLIEAVAQLGKDFPDLLLVLAGLGPQQSDLALQASRLGIRDRVRFLGHCPDVQVVYDAIDVFALPSVCETFGYALLEAMATCLPAVGSVVGGIPEILVDGKTGFLVPARDSQALANSIHRLLESAELRQRFGRAGRERAEHHFREDQMVERTIAVYRELLPTASCRPSSELVAQPNASPALT